MCISGLGNILVIGSVLIHKKLRVLSNVFVVNLAVADLCVVLAVDVFTILGIHTHGMVFYKRPILCEILGVICVTSCSCSLWTIAAIALNRYICICHRLHYIRLFKKKTMVIYIIILWTFSFLIDFPILLGWGRHGFDERVLFCSFDISASFTYNIYLAVLFMVVPFITLTVSYTGIIRYSQGVKKRLKQIAKEDIIPGSDFRTTDLRLLKSVSVIWIVFALFWLPFTMFTLFDSNVRWGRSGYVIATALAHSSSSVNSLIYAVTNKDFREAYARQLRWLFCCCGSLFGTVHQSSVAINYISRSNTRIDEEAL